jgi:hypothetical protein
MLNLNLIIVFIAVYFVSIYFAYKFGYKKGKNYIIHNDSENPKFWRSNRWKYEISFPSDWNPIKRGDKSIKSPDADIFCQSSRGYSCVVFVYKSLKSESLTQVSRNILQQYKDQFGVNKIIKENEYIKNEISYRKIIFNRESMIHFYTFVIHNSYLYIISSNSPEEYFETAEYDFDYIIESIKFF